MEEAALQENTQWMSYIVNELADDFAIDSWVAVSYYSNVHDIGDIVNYSFAI